MYREKRRNKIIFLILVGIICLMGVGYAAFQTSLNITGTSEISSDWNIKIISADVTDTGGDGENVKNNYSDLTADLEANLYNKGDYVEYSIIVENAGTFDAKLETLGITNSNNEAVKITSSGLTKGQTLYKNTTATLKVRIEYNSAYEGDASGTSGESTIDLDFVQNSGGTIEPETTHLVTYDYTTNGGTSTTAENAYVAEGESIDLSYTAEKEGYDFVGWNTNSGASEGLTELTMGTEDVTLYAIFKQPDTTPPVIENVSTTSTTNSITVVVTASDLESGISKYEFKIDDGDWIDNGTNNSYTFTDLIQSTGYNISVRVTNGVSLTTEEELDKSINLTDNVVSTGDGLYKDAYEEGRYIYKGANPNNYVRFNNELWRIIALENDGTMKIVRNEVLSDQAWDTSNSNNWARPATLNTYLNETYYNSLTVVAQSQISEHNFGIGEVTWNNTNLAGQIADENGTVWSGKIGLITASDYIRSNTNNSQCGNFSRINTNYSTCKNTTYLFTGSQWWIFSPASNGTSSRNIQASGQINSNSVNTIDNYRPALYLKNNVDIISGEGTSNNPFILGIGIATSTLNKPTFSEVETDNGKTVTITYPEGEGLTYEYQKDNGSWATATQIQQVEFTESGILVARVSDGTNTEIATYSVKIASAGSDLVDQAGVVTSGDGLYADSYESNVYTYRGSNPNNYVTFNGESWRIISANTSDNTIKITRNEVVLSYQIDTEGRRYQGDDGYCNTYNYNGYGCNIWGSSSTLYDVNMNHITTLAREIGGTAYALPTAEADLNVYLNTTYYNGLSSESRNMLVDSIYKSGTLSRTSNQTISTDINQVSATKWKGKVALIDATEYVRASTNSSCTGVYEYYNTSSCYNDSDSHNWMYIPENAWWTMSPLSGDATSMEWYVHVNGNFSLWRVDYGTGVRPVVTLSPEVQITGGDGSSGNPYILTI